MGRFAQIAKGTRAVKRISFPFRDGAATCAVRPLSGSEEAAVLERARAFAVSRGLADPKVGDELYEFGRWVHTVALGCVDEEAPTASYFAGPEEVLEELDRDRIAFVFELQQAWQDECSPSRKSLSDEEYRNSIADMALDGEDDELPFAKWGPGLRVSWARTSAKLLVSLLAPSSASG